jgi:hypothetical protein
MSYFTYLANRDADPDQARRLAEAALAPAVPVTVPIYVSHMTITERLHRLSDGIARRQHSGASDRADIFREDGNGVRGPDHRRYVIDRRRTTPDLRTARHLLGGRPPREQRGQGGRRLLRDDAVPEGFQLVVSGEAGDGGDPPVVESHHPFDEPWGEALTVPGVRLGRVGRGPA